MALPRVTEVLKPFSGFRHVKADILERAAARGTMVHGICAALAGGSWMPTTMIAEELQGYVQSFREWAEVRTAEFLLIEERFNDPQLGYTGQIDFVIKDRDGKVWLVDLKTSAYPQKTYPVQMAAYQHLLETHDILVHGALLVYLDKHGQFPEEDVIEDFRDTWAVFEGALTCYYYFNEGKVDARPTESGTEHPSETVDGDE